MDLRSFIHLLEREGELVRVRAEVDPYLEMAEIADRASKAHGPALLFERPVRRGAPGGAAASLGRVSAWDAPLPPVLMNQFGSFRRLELALGASLDELAGRLAGLLELDLPSGLAAKVRALGELRELASFAPKTVKKGAFREVVVEPPDLTRLPVLTTWPGDGGPFITLPVVVTKDRQGRRNAGMYRLQVYDERTTGMHWHVHHDGAANFRAADRRLEVAVALGTDPVVTYAATAPLPPGISEFLFAGLLRGAPVELAPCATVDLEVPADAEIVLEGYVDKDETRREGPFGDHTGYYSLADEYPVFHVTAMSHRRDPVYPATIVGRPPMEDAYLGKATERLFLPLLKLVQPEIVDMDLPIEGVFHDCAIVAIRKSYPGQARKVMSAVWGMGQMMFTKFVVVVDEHVDVHDYSEVTWRVFNNVDPRRDCVVVDGPLDVLDHSSPSPRYGAKMGVDATRTWPEEGHGREWPAELAQDPDVVRRVSERWAELGLPFA
ncbi:MAG TPA: menaquinone biosynthesis decarboxylase [Thermoleophilia bacterium]|nr:menaquinone biosynthesis decarboxylase [Thermoleophilia bacterium]